MPPRHYGRRPPADDFFAFAMPVFISPLSPDIAADAAAAFSSFQPPMLSSLNIFAMAPDDADIIFISYF